MKGVNRQLYKSVFTQSRDESGPISPAHATLCRCSLSFPKDTIVSDLVSCQYRHLELAGNPAYSPLYALRSPDSEGKVLGLEKAPRSGCPNVPTHIRIQNHIVP